MAWVLRGLRDGVVTTRYPARRDQYGETFPGAVGVNRHAPAPHPDVPRICPTGAIGRRDGRVTLDRGRCILCGACVRVFPETFAWRPGSETAALGTTALQVPVDVLETEQLLAATREELARRVRRLRRSVHIRHVDAGSDGTEEWEIQALLNPTYDIHRLGIFVTASPRHADILMITGAGARGMLAPLARTREGMPEPVVVMAVGTDAISGGLVDGTYATTGGVLEQLPADVLVPGSPPPPFAILHGILLALGRVPVRRRPTTGTAS
jgi:Ni,Fe-hydrogenase III small subunit/ferredoxin